MYCILKKAVSYAIPSAATDSQLHYYRQQPLTVPIQDRQQRLTVSYPRPSAATDSQLYKTTVIKGSPHSPRLA